MRQLVAGTSCQNCLCQTSGVIPGIHIPLALPEGTSFNTHHLTCLVRDALPQPYGYLVSEGMEESHLDGTSEPAAAVGVGKRIQVKV